MSRINRRSGIDPNSPEAIRRISEMLRVWNGEGREPQERVITEKRLREMLDEGGGSLREAFRNAVSRRISEGAEGDEDPTIEVPLAPEILSVDIGFDTVMFRWGTPGYDGHAYTEVWRNVQAAEFDAERAYALSEVVQYQGILYRARKTLDEPPPTPEDEQAWEAIGPVDELGGDAQGDSRAGASLLTVAQGRSFVDSSLEPGVTYYYWFRFVNQLGNPGPWNDDQGIEVALRPRPTQLIEQLVDQIEETQLSEDLRSRVDLIDGPEDLDFSVSWRLRQEAEARTNEIQREIQAIENQLNEALGSLSDVLAAPEYDENSAYSQGDVVLWCEKLYRALQDMEPPAPHPEEPEYWVKIGNYASVSEAVSAQAATLRDHAAEITRHGNKLTAMAADVMGLVAQIEDPETGLETRASVEALNQAIAGEEEARSTSIDRLDSRIGPSPFHPFRDYHKDDEVAYAGAVYRLVADQVIPDLEADPPQAAPDESEDWEFVEELDDATLVAAMSTTFEQGLANEEQARVTQFEELDGRLGDNEGAITDLREVDVTLDRTLALDSSVQEVRYLSNRTASEARNEVFRTSLANTEQSLATRYQVLEASFAWTQDELANRATVSQLEEVKSTEDEARATALRQVEAVFGAEYPFWDQATHYEIGDRTIYLGVVYEALKVMEAPSPNPRHGEEGYWQKIEEIASSAANVERLEEAIADEHGARAEEFSRVQARFERDAFRMDGQDRRMDVQGNLIDMLDQAKADVTQLDRAQVDFTEAIAESTRQVNAVLGVDYDYWTSANRYSKGQIVYWEGKLWKAKSDREPGDANPVASFEWEEYGEPQSFSAAVQERMVARVGADGEPRAGWGIYMETTEEGRTVTSGFGIEDEGGEVTFGVDAHTFFVRNPSDVGLWISHADYHAGDVVRYDGQIYVALRDMGALPESPWHENTDPPDTDPTTEVVVENDDLPADEGQETENQWGITVPKSRRYGERKLWRHLGPVGAAYPFMVDGEGRTFINSAFNPYASIEYAHMGDAFIEDLRATQIFADRAEFDTANVFTLLQIGSAERVGEKAVLESANWNGGAGYGFHLNNKGEFALKSRPSGGRVEHNANGIQVYDDNGRLRVALGRLVG